MQDYLHLLEKRLSLQPLFKNDSVAQLVEHLPFKEGVLGSSPSRVTKKFFKSVVYQRFWCLNKFLFLLPRW